jgi:hypothetical protein
LEVLESFLKALEGLLEVFEGLTGIQESLPSRGHRKAFRRALEGLSEAGMPFEGRKFPFFSIFF